MVEVEKSKSSNNSLLKNHLVIISIGCVLFVIEAFLNVYHQFLQRHSQNYVLTGYIFFAISAISILLIAVGIHQLTEVYFVDHITKAGKYAMYGLLAYSGSILVDLLVLGWPVTAGIVGFTLIFGRIYGFTRLNKVFKKIKTIFGIKIGTIFLPIFAYFSVLISITSGIANFSQDLDFRSYLLLFNGAIESILMVIIGIKIIVDCFRIRNYILKNNIKPYSEKTAFLVRERSDQPILPTTKEHLQSRKQIEMLQEKTQQADSNASRNNQFLRIDKIERIKIQKEIEFDVEDQIPSRKRTLSISKERVLQYTVMIISSIIFILYSFLTSSPVLIGISWLIICIFGTYIIINIIVNFVFGEGYAFTAILSDILYLLVFLPSLSLTFASIVVLITGFAISFSPESSRILSFSLGGLFLIIALAVAVNRSLEKLNMNLRDYLSYFFNMEARKEKLLSEMRIAQQKRGKFNQLDEIAAKVEARLEEQEIHYEDFDFKERLKDLGSPLKSE